MSVRLKPGSPLAVVRPGVDGRPLRISGQVTSSDDLTIGATFENDDGWEAGQPVVLLADERDGMWAAPAVCERTCATGASFRALRPWRRVNRRGTPRFPTRLSATVRSGQPARATPGRLLDISAGGARVALQEPPAEGGVELLISALDHRATIPCSVVATTVNGSVFETRLSFDDVEPEDQSFLATLLDVMGHLARQGRDLLAQ